MATLDPFANPGTTQHLQRRRRRRRRRQGWGEEGGLDWARQVILAVGNFLNAGSYRGDAYGFKVILPPIF